MTDLTPEQGAALVDRAMATLGLKRAYELDQLMGWPSSTSSKLRTSPTTPAQRRRAADLMKRLDEAPPAHVEPAPAEPAPVEPGPWQAIGRRLPRPAPQPVSPATPTPVTLIDWRSFVREGITQDGRTVRGVSLRALVDAGLYASWQMASAALERFDRRAKICDVVINVRADHLFMTVRDAQLFCVHARSEGARQILQVILDHHDEFQRLIEGDPEAHARLDQTRALTPEPTDPLLASLAALAQMRRAQLAHEERLRDAEGQLAAVDARSLDLVRRLDGLTHVVTAPAPEVLAPERTQRQELRVLVEGAARSRGLAYEEAWRQLYAEYRLRQGVDLRARAKAAKAASHLAYAEEHGHLPALYAVAWAMWRPTDT